MATDWIEHRDALARAVGMLCMSDASLRERIEMAYEEVEGVDGSRLPEEVAVGWNDMVRRKSGSPDRRAKKPRLIQDMTDQEAREAAARFMSLWRHLDLLTLR